MGNEAERTNKEIAATNESTKNVKQLGKIKIKNNSNNKQGWQNKWKK